MNPSKNEQRGSAAQFRSTHWSIVVAAAGKSSIESRQAMAELCRAYWYPLYAFVRRQGNSAADAQDLTQGFFERLLEKKHKYLAGVAPEKGKFRSFLLASLKHYLANQRDRARAAKRGGRKTLVALEAFDFKSAESRYRVEPAQTMTAERIFERRWALTLLDRVVQRLQAEYAARGKPALFEQLKECLTSPDLGRPYDQLAIRLDMTVGAVKVAVHRLRRRYRELLRDEISQTVAEPSEIDDEIRQLFAALAAD